jgi:serine protease AprX
MKQDRPRSWWTLCMALALSAGVAVPCAAGQSARAIMQFATTADRDAAFDALLDRGAAVRIADTEAGPALVAIGSAALLRGDYNATQISDDAGVSVTAVKQPARGNFVRRVEAAENLGFDPSRAGIAVAIIDSGIQPHADLPLSRIRAFKDFVTGAATPVDNCGHGTHVAGIIGGSGRSSDGLYAGIAPTVDIVSLRVLGDDCSGNTSDVIDALEWIGRNHALHRIKVVNLSLGHAVLESIYSDPLVQAVERLSRKGIAVVTAAGNRGINLATNRPGYGGAGVPCNAPSSICVGSLDTLGSPALDDDQVSASSGRGPTRFDLLAKPDLVAPGVDIVSLASPGSRLFSEFPDLQVGGSNGEPQYFMLSGTSMASPAVAAAAALLLQANHGLSANTLKLALQFTARLVPLTDVLTQGAGALNVPGALTLADAINPNVRRGTNWIRHRITAANVDAYGQRIRWGQRIVYGDRFVRPRYAQLHLFRWDDDIVWSYDAIADNIVWGNAADNIVWGNDDNIVWGNEDNIVWGNDDNIVWGNSEDDNMVWGNDESDNLVWGIDDNIVWGNDDNIAWGNSASDNIVWGNGTMRDVWATDVVDGFWWSDDPRR